MSSRHKTQSNVPTGLNILGSGIVYRDARRVWMKKARAIMRLNLLKRLQAEGLGLQQVENFVQNESKFRLSNKFRSKDIRDPSKIEFIMKSRIRDAYEAVRETTQVKSKLKKKLTSVLKKNKILSEKVFQQLEREKERTITLIKQKNEKKIRWLREKNLKKEDKSEKQIPDILSKYEEINIFQNKTDVKENESEIKVMVIGEVQIDDEELSVLKLPPDFAALANLSEEDFLHDEEMAMAKLRWEKKKMIEEDLGDNNVTVTEEEKEEIDLIEAQSRQIFDPINKVLDLRKRRVTDLKENSKVYLPKPLPSYEEAKIEIRREQYEKVFKEYVNENCSESGGQKSNLTWSQKNGLKKLLKRKKDGDIIVLTTDKSGKFAVTEMETYLAMGAIHTSKDSVVSDHEVKKIQRLHNGHVAMWTRMTSMGQVWKHEDRIRESCIQHTCTIPPMYLLVKDHKKTKEGDLPATRPVVSGTSGMGLSMSNILSDMVESLANMRPDTIEVISTEDLLSRVNDYNEKYAEKANDAVLTGCDAVQLFPSLKAAESGKAVREATIKIMKKTGFIVDGLDYREMRKYIRMNLSDQEISERRLMRVIPVRKFQRGRMPGMTGSEALKKVEEDEDKFIYTDIELTRDEEINLFATSLEIAVKFMFTHHVYSFGGVNYLQTDSGPIGLRITMAVARLVMGEFGERMREILSEADIDIFLQGLFVDDGRYVTSCIPDGVRFCHRDNKFIFREDWKVEDSKSSEADRKKKTSSELCKAMNSLFSNIRFTVESEEDFENKRLPTLDCDMWMEKLESGNYLRYSFYEKPMKNPYCIMKSSAMSEKSKIQILAQDLIRRMQNICDSVSQTERNKVVNDYTDRLFRSGYCHSQVREIIISGLVGYERKVARAARDKVPLHRPAAITLKTRLHKKLTQRENWFKGKKKNHESKNKNQNKNIKKKEDFVPPIVSVMFVQQTPNSQLLQQLRQTESKIMAVTGDRVKLVERSGTKLRHMLVSSDPWRNTKCSDKKCLVCTNPLNTNFLCRKRNVSYKTYCLKCAEEAGIDQKSIKSNINENIKFYFGETFRDANTRGAEHLSDYARKSEDSHMMKHLSENHPNCSPKDIKFGMSVVKSHRSSFERMIMESILIFRAGNNVLNSKSEFSRCVVPRLSVMVGEDDKDKDVVPLVFEKKKLNKRLSDEEANIGFIPKKRKCNVLSNSIEVDGKDDDHIDSKTNEKLEETSPTQLPVPSDFALDEETTFLKAPTTSDHRKFRKPNPTKNNSKKSNLKGQSKISSYFTNTKDEGKFVLETFTTQTDPT